LLQLAADGQVVREPLGHDALWRRAGAPEALLREERTATVAS
jgi:hypothetical protein